MSSYSAFLKDKKEAFLAAHANAQRELDVAISQSDSFDTHENYHAIKSSIGSNAFFAMNSILNSRTSETKAAIKQIDAVLRNIDHEMNLISW